MHTNYLLLGLGISNQSAAKILLQNKQTFVVWDDNPKIIEWAKSQKYEIYDQTKHKNIHTIVLSPGIRNHKLLDLITSSTSNNTSNLHTPNIINEIELFFQFTQNTNMKIACTGSFGKSTTVSLISHVLNQNNNPAKAVGNIGTTLDQLKDNEIGIFELSSFQLEKLNKAKFDIGIILNIKHHHLDYHKDFEDYFAAKCKLIDLSKHMLVDTDIINLIKHDSPSNITQYDMSLNSDNTEKTYQTHNYKTDHINELNFSQLPENIQSTYYQKLLHIPQNSFAACYTVCKQLNIVEQDIINACSDFNLLPHRQEIISNSPLIINDSKSTSLNCSIYLLEKISQQYAHGTNHNIQEKNIFWIVGGKNAPINPEDISKINSITNIKHIFIYGENRNILHDLFNHDSSIYKNLDELMLHLSKHHANESIIFSPGFQSLDQFKNFEARGDKFKKLVQNLKSNIS